MITQVGITVGGNKMELEGLSADTKPTITFNNTLIGAGSTFYELDTKNGFEYDPNNICPTTGNNWWPV